MLLLALILSFAIAGMLFSKLTPRSKRLRFSFYLGAIQLLFGSASILATSFNAASPFSCILGGLGVYVNPTATLIDMISLLTLSRSKYHDSNRLQLVIYIGFVAARLLAHILAGAAHYWSFGFCTI